MDFTQPGNITILIVFQFTRSIITHRVCNYYIIQFNRSIINTGGNTRHKQSINSGNRVHGRCKNGSGTDTRTVSTNGYYFYIMQIYGGNCCGT